MLDRRTFLAAAAAAGCPDWLVRGFAQDPGAADDYARLADLRRAWARAVARGKPLLVFVVPSDPRELYDRGYVLGALLQHTGDATLLDLALVEMQCGTVAEVEAVVGEAAAGGAAGGRTMSGAEPRQEPRPAEDREPLLLLVESDGAAAGAPTVGKAAERKTSDKAGTHGAAAGSTVAHAARVTALPSAAEQIAVTQALRPVPGRNGDAGQALAKLATVVRRAIAGDVGRLASLADANRATLTDDERAALERAFAGTSTFSPPTTALLLRAAAVLRMAALAPRRPEDRDRLHAELVAAVRAAYLKEPIGGARWAQAMGCAGERIEGPPLPSRRDVVFGPCGTGFVPPLGRRFLFFVARDER